MTFTTRGLYASSSKVPKRRRFGALALLGALLGLLALLYVAMASVVLLTQYQESRSDDFTDVTEVRIENDSGGSVEVRGGGGDTTTIRRDVSGSALSHPDETLTEEGGVVRAETDWRDCGNDALLPWGVCAIDYEITVPDGVSVDIDATSGTVTVAGVDGDAVVTATSGDIDVTDVTGDVDVAGVSGSITVDRTDGDVAARATSGGITVSEVGADVRAETTSGNVNLRDIDAERVEASTTSGNVDVEGAFGIARLGGVSGNVTVTAVEPFEEITAEATSGNVTANVADDGPFDVVTSTTSGSENIEVDTAADAAARIEASTTSGSVTVRSR